MKSSKVTREFCDLVLRAFKEKPDPKDIHELRKWLQEKPELWHSVFDIVEVVRTNLIQRAISYKAGGIAIEANITEMKKEMGYENASPLEKLLIDNILITWLRLQWVEYQLVGFMGQGEVRMSVVEFWEKRLSMSQRRHLRACETLARVHKLLSDRPALQVNIATQSGQQLNVTGNVIKK